MGCRGRAAESAFLIKKKVFFGLGEGRLPQDVMQGCKMWQQLSRREQTLLRSLVCSLESSPCHQRASGWESRAVLPLFGFDLPSEHQGQVVAGQAGRRPLAGA